ncbi:MAG: dihydroorotate dehydrogenase, partial [Desulfobacteraceae bacterium]|nr:dihydroorotate dehydrogenase [Desulfobacteraceae bacterium]
MTEFLGIQLKTPLVLASGILGNNADILSRVHRAGCGLVTMKSIGPVRRDGHNNPTVIDLGCGMINAVGLPTPGYHNMDAEWQALADRDFPLNASIYGGSTAEFAEVARFVADQGPDCIEINISCPNSDHHGMLFGVDEKA